MQICLVCVHQVRVCRLLRPVFVVFVVFASAFVFCVAASLSLCILLNLLCPVSVSVCQCWQEAVDQVHGSIEPFVALVRVVSMK